jgi:hypothetical protein
VAKNYVIWPRSFLRQTYEIEARFIQLSEDVLGTLIDKMYSLQSFAKRTNRAEQPLRKSKKMQNFDFLFAPMNSLVFKIV